MAAVTSSSSLEISVQPVAEIVPIAPPTTGSAAPKPYSAASSSAVESKAVSKTCSDTADAPGISERPSIQSVADRIGMKFSGSDRAIRTMWSQWHKTGVVKPFDENHTTSLDRYYNNLVTLYILAHHQGESGLCFAILLQFHRTNYTFRDELPNVPTAVLAFQFLPEDDNLCKWVGTLLAFLWGTRQWKNHEHLLSEFPEINGDAFCKFIFAIARTRDPFRKGHNTAVLAQ